MIEERKITCLEDTIKIVRSIREGISKGKSNDFFGYNTLNGKNAFTDVWFRGEAMCYDRPLCPKIFRKNYDETKIFNFLPTYIQELRKIESDFDMLSYMQHNGVPTRLIDWTDNILVALFFAVNTHPDSDGKLFVLNSRLLNVFTGLRKGINNILVKDSIGTIFRCLMIRSENSVEGDNLSRKTLGEDFDWKRSDINEIPIKEIFSTNTDMIKNNLNLKIDIFCTPVAVRPDKFHDRIIQQRGLFTLHGGKNKVNENGIESMEIPYPKSLIELNKKGKFLLEYYVPKKYKVIIRNDLISLQIHKGTVFPELYKQEEFIDLLALEEEDYEKIS